MTSDDLADFPRLGDAAAEHMLRARFQWYSRQATLTRRAYLALGLLQLLSALLIATSIAFHAPRWLAPVLGAAIAFVEGVRTLFGVQDRYLGYRSAAEEPRNEAWLFAQRTGPYRAVEAPELLLAERVADVGQRENSTWAASLRGGQTPAA